MHILMHNGKPVVVSDGQDKLIGRAQLMAGAKGSGRLEWNSSHERLFRVTSDGRKRFTGLEVREVEST